MNRKQHLTTAFASKTAFDALAVSDEEEIEEEQEDDVPSSEPMSVGLPPFQTLY